jgi:hypothetical protein
MYSHPSGDWLKKVDMYSHPLGDWFKKVDMYSYPSGEHPKMRDLQNDRICSVCRICSDLQGAVGATLGR